MNNTNIKTNFEGIPMTCLYSTIMSCGINAFVTSNQSKIYIYLAIPEYLLSFYNDIHYSYLDDKFRETDNIDIKRCLMICIDDVPSKWLVSEELGSCNIDTIKVTIKHISEVDKVINTEYFRYCNNRQCEEFVRKIRENFGIYRGRYKSKEMPEPIRLFCDDVALLLPKLQSQITPFENSSSDPFKMYNDYHSMCNTITDKAIKLFEKYHDTEYINILSPFIGTKLFEDNNKSLHYTVAIDSQQPLSKMIESNKDAMKKLRKTIKTLSRNMNIPEDVKKLADYTIGILKKDNEISNAKINIDILKRKRQDLTNTLLKECGNDPMLCQLIRCIAHIRM